jgi:hypothetical protein
MGVIHRSSTSAVDFLRRSLAAGALGVLELEVKARAAGLLGERQQIQHAKAFIKAKKHLAYGPFGMGSESMVNGPGLCRYRPPRLRSSRRPIRR